MFSGFSQIFSEFSWMTSNFLIFSGFFPIYSGYSDLNLRCRYPAKRYLIRFRQTQSSPSTETAKSSGKLARAGAAPLVGGAAVRRAPVRLASLRVGIGDSNEREIFYFAFVLRLFASVNGQGRRRSRIQLPRAPDLCRLVSLCLARSRFCRLAHSLPGKMNGCHFWALRQSLTVRCICRVTTRPGSPWLSGLCLGLCRGSPSTASPGNPAAETFSGDEDAWGLSILARRKHRFVWRSTILRTDCWNW